MRGLILAMRVNQDIDIGHSHRPSSRKDDSSTGVVSLAFAPPCTGIRKCEAAPGFALDRSASRKAWVAR
jgi:hypothetical protein